MLASFVQVKRNSFWESLDTWKNWINKPEILVSGGLEVCCRFCFGLFTKRKMAICTQVLGTFITEWKEGTQVCHELLASSESCRMYASRLAELAEVLGFEGWLVRMLPAYVHFLQLPNFPFAVLFSFLNCRNTHLFWKAQIEVRLGYSQPMWLHWWVLSLGHRLTSRM